MNKNVLLTVVIIFIAVTGGVLYFKEGNVETSFNNTENATQLGIIFENPKPSSKVESPLKVSGQARGTWYFEATFPVSLLDKDGNQLSAGFVEAQGDWMTEEFVPFEGELEFDVPQGITEGFLVLEKANPSGLQEHREEIRIPVLFE